MKITLLIVLALLVAGCGPLTQPSPAAAQLVPVETNGPSPATVTQLPTASIPSATPLPTSTLEPEPTPTAAPITEPVIAARFPFQMEDGLGFGSVILALPGGQVWETTLGGGVRVYNSKDMTVLQSLDLGGKENAVSLLAGDSDYVWALFSDTMDETNPVDLFRVSRADFTYRQVDLPETCTYDACQWSTMLLDDGVLWVGGYDELLAIDAETLQPVTQFLFSEQAHTFNPNEVKDIDVTEDGQVWSLFCWDTCYIVILDRQRLLDGVDQEPGMIGFESPWIEFVANVGDAMWAGESRNGNVEVLPAALYPLGEIGAALNQSDAIALPDDLEFFIMGGMNLATDGSHLWLLHENGRQLYWFDPAAQETGILPVYPGDEPTDEDFGMLMWLSFDGQYLWASGSEMMRIALPWTQ